MQRDRSAQMSEIPPGTFKSRSRGNWIRLRTLVVLRWWAIAGQVTALIVAQRLYNLDLEIGLCFLVIGVSVVSNLVAAFIYPENKRLSESETLLVVLFDMLQLGLLLFLTGGLNNPFSILIVGPVTVSASAISSRSTMFLGLTAILTVSLLTQFHLPLRTEQDFVLRMPDLFLFGNWAAIVIAIIFLGVYSRWIVSEMDAMSDALQATQMALAREQKLTDLGGVIAAAAHELGTPLATIKLTSAELADELSDNSELRDDALLIRQQADRCRDLEGTREHGPECDAGPEECRKHKRRDKRRDNHDDARGDAQNAAEHQPAPAFALADVTYRGDEAEHAVGKGERAEDQRERQKRFRRHDEG